MLGELHLEIFGKSLGEPTVGLVRGEGEGQRWTWHVGVHPETVAFVPDRKRWSMVVFSST